MNSFSFIIPSTSTCGEKSETELGSRAWRVERKEYLTFHKTNNLNKNIGISIYKNKSKCWIILVSASK
ncbi:hypothetical protein [Spiroplasma ixodetis]|uniref:hypothetical protein n=1 Tax=Spiroplasma ixodetis TaxID=2141 RepID=UPI00248FEE76|nr:hypothetical protein [Spiroplasma ixodetis]